MLIDNRWRTLDVTPLERCWLWKESFPLNLLEVVSCKMNDEMSAFIRREEDVGCHFIDENEHNDKPAYWYLRVVGINKFRTQFKVTDEVVIFEQSV